MFHFVSQLCFGGTVFGFVWVTVGFAWLFLVELVAWVLCVVLCCGKLLKVVFVCVNRCLLFQVALVFRSCSNCLQLSQVIVSSIWL